MRTFSVQIENNDYNDDMFNGTFDECVEYINEYYPDDETARIAEIEVENNVATYTYDIITIW